MAASAARPRTLPGALSAHGHPLSPRECPRRALSPAIHLLPVIRGPLLRGAWNSGAGLRVPGLSGWKRADPSVPTAQLRRTGGRPPGDGFVQSRGWPVSGQDAGPGRLRTGSPSTSLPRGNGPHPGHIRPASQGPWGRVGGTGSSPRHPEVRSFSRGPHLPGRLPPRQRQSAREELGTRGLDEGRARVPRLVGRGPGGPDPRPGTPSPGGTRA